MAVIKFGQSIAGIRGTIGGVTFSHNKGGAYAKSWGRPAFKASAYQLTFRQFVSELSTTWRDMDAAERALWQDLADDPPETDHDQFGNIRLLTGYNWFSRINVRRRLVGLDPTETCPVSGPIVHPTMNSLSLKDPSDPGGECIVSFDAATFSDGEYAKVELCVSPNPGKTYPPAQFRICFFSDVNAADTEIDFTSLANDHFGYVPAGYRGFVRVHRLADDLVSSPAWDITDLFVAV